MRSIITVLFLIVPMAMAVDFNIVFIDLDETFNQYYRTKLADRQLKEMQSDAGSERQELVVEYEALRKDFLQAREDAANSALEVDVQDQRRAEAEELLLQIREKEAAINQFEETRRKQVREQGRRMRKRILEDIREKIESYSRRKGYSAVLDISGQSLNGETVVLYADERVDITREMISMLNEGQQE